MSFEVNGWGGGILLSEISQTENVENKSSFLSYTNTNSLENVLLAVLRNLCLERTQRGEKENQSINQSIHGDWMGSVLSAGMYGAIASKPIDNVRPENMSVLQLTSSGAQCLGAPA